MASAKIIFHSNQVYKDGTCPVLLQVIQTNSPKRYRTLAKVPPDQWNDKDKRVKKNNRHAAQLNVKIVDSLTLVERALLKADGRPLFNPFAVLENQAAGSSFATFNEIADQYLQSVKLNSGATFINSESKIRIFKAFVKNDNLTLDDITEPLLTKFISHLVNKGNSAITIKQAFSVLSRISNFAQENNLGKKPAALLTVKLPKLKPSQKEKLTQAELKAFGAVYFEEGTKEKEAQDAFLLSVYLRGMRFADLMQLKPAHFIGGRLSYVSGKNKKLFNMEVPEAAKLIIERYQHKKGYLFRFFQWQPREGKTVEENNVRQAIELTTANNALNSALKKVAHEAGITKSVTIHIARHTFAKIAIDHIKDPNLTMDLLGHGSLQVHQAYIRSISQSDTLDKAVNGFFDSGKD